MYPYELYPISMNKSLKDMKNGVMPYGTRMAPRLILILLCISRSPSWVGSVRS